MKTEFLSGLGITDQNVINQILAENGRDIERIKGERDALQTQLQTAQTTLKSFEGVNPTQLQNEVTRLTNELSAKEAEYNRQIADRDFNDLLRTTAADYNPRDIKAVMPFLDVEQLEVDFICSKGSRKYYIQSAYMLGTEEKMAQEIRPFLKINDSFKKIVITSNIPRPFYTEDGILMMSVYDFLLNPDSLEL